MHCPFACVLSSLARWESSPSSPWAHIVHCRPERTRRPSSHEAIPPRSPKRLMVGFSSDQLRLWAELKSRWGNRMSSGKKLFYSHHLCFLLWKSGEDVLLWKCNHSSLMNHSIIYLITCDYSGNQMWVKSNHSFLFIYFWNTVLQGRDWDIYLKGWFILCEFCIDSMPCSEVNLKMVMNAFHHPDHPWHFPCHHDGFLIRFLWLLSDVAISLA